MAFRPDKVRLDKVHIGTNMIDTTAVNMVIWVVKLVQINTNQRIAIDLKGSCIYHYSGDFSYSSLVQ